MQIITTLPDGWSVDKLNAFNDVASAALAYMVYDNALTKLNVNDPTLLQDRTDVGNLVKQLGQTLKATQ